MGCPRVVAPGTHGTGLPRSTGSATVRLGRAAVAAPLALAASAAFVPTTILTAGAAAIATVVTTVVARGGANSSRGAPACAGATRIGYDVEGGIGNGLLIVGQAELLKNQHIMSSSERGKNAEIDGVALHRGVELIEEEDGVWLLIGMEDPLDVHPEIMGGRIGVIHGEIEDGVVDKAEDLATNAALCGVPLGIIGLRRSGAVDVRAKTELAA